MPSSIIDRALPKVPRSDVADRAIGQKQSIGRSRILPIKLRIIEESKKEKVHIFNVGPWAQTCEYRVNWHFHHSCVSQRG